MYWYIHEGWMLLLTYLKLFFNFGFCIIFIFSYLTDTQKKINPPTPTKCFLWTNHTVLQFLSGAFNVHLCSDSNSLRGMLKCFTNGKATWRNAREADCQGQEWQGICTWRHGLHVFGKFAADAVIISADVMETPSRQLLSIVELQKKKQNKNMGVKRFKITGCQMNPGWITMAN